MATLTIYGDQVASEFSMGSTTPTTTDWYVGDTPFLSTDIVRIDISDTSLDANGEFDPVSVVYESFTVERDGVIYEFGVAPEIVAIAPAYMTYDAVMAPGGTAYDSPIDSGAEQGDTFFTTSTSFMPPSTGPFAGLSVQPYLVSVDGSFSSGSGTYQLDRYTDIDLNNDGDVLDAAEEGNAIFNIGAGLLCFVAGTMISTPEGERPVEELRVGQDVLTLDHEAQKIMWLHSRTLTWDAGPSKDMPIRFEVGSLGDGLPRRVLDVSPQHRMLAKGHPEFGEVLTPAKALTDLKGVRQQKSVRTTTYVHVLCENHEILFAEGACAESLLLREPFLETLDEVQKETISSNMEWSHSHGDDLLCPTAARHLLTVQQSRHAIGHSLQF